MYGGAGRDVMLINTNGDRAIDWVGEYNSYYTPFSAFGFASVLRLIRPAVPEYLLDLSESQGADQTLSAIYGGDPARNGEPFGELGMVLQQDAEYGDQNGAPRDPQPGHMKGKLDVNRSAGELPIYLTAGEVGEGGPSLSDADLAATVEQVKDLWRGVPGISDTMFSRLDGVRVGVGNLPGEGLGMMLGDTVLIDADAAGFGWVVDRTPWESSEFTVEAERSVFRAASESAAYGSYDLVTVVAHELGHALGFDHHSDERFPVLRDELDPGMRYAFTAAAPASETGRLLAQPAAAAMPSYGFDMAGGQGPSVAVVDWQASAGGDWGAQLSPYASAKTAPKLAPSIAPFAPPLPFDGMGKALLGKGKTGR
jgi:hypothetical protein